MLPRKGCALRSGVEIAYALVYRVSSTRQQDATDIEGGTSREQRTNSVMIILCLRDLLFLFNFFGGVILAIAYDY